MGQCRMRRRTRGMAISRDLDNPLFPHAEDAECAIKGMKTKVTSALLGAFGAVLTALTSGALSAPPDGLRALDGEWLYVEDRTEGRTLERWSPPMSSKFSM